MIILDAEENQLPKLDSPPLLHLRTNRPSTPTPSLPDYETSQELLRQDLIKKKPMSRRLKWTIWGLIAYFVVTVAIGVPLIVVKTRKDSSYYKNPSMLYPSRGGNMSGANVPGFNLGAFPICIDSASTCDDWSVRDEREGSLLKAHLEYYVYLNDTVFVQSNATYWKSTTTPSPITGSLDVGVNPDTTEPRVSIYVDMSYTGTYIRERTKVCVVNLDGQDGLYLFVPNNLTEPDHLDFSIKMLFPSSNSSTPLYVSNFLTSLPYFSQNFSLSDPEVTFGNVALGGYSSNINLDLLQAEAIFIKSPFAGVSGAFNASNSDDDDTS